MKVMSTESTPSTNVVPFVAPPAPAKRARAFPPVPEAIGTVLGMPIVPATTGSILTEAAIDHLLGLPGATQAPFVRPGQMPPAEGPYLFQARVRKRLVWKIRDRLSRSEKQLEVKRKLGRLSTGCEVGDEKGAARFWFLWLGQRRNASLGVILPTQIKISAVLLHFAKHLGVQLAMKQITLDSFDYHSCNLTAVTAFWGEKKLSEVTTLNCGAYMEWRMAQRIATQNEEAEEPRFVSFSTARHELETFNRVVNVYKKATPVNLDVKVTVPKPMRHKLVWLTRDEVARLLWTCRGRVWNPQAGRWRIRSDDDPSLAGTPEGARHVIDENYAAGAGRVMARLLPFGIYSGSRSTVMVTASYFDSAESPHFDGVVFHRRGIDVNETAKRTPSIILPAKLDFLNRHWRRRALATGVAHVIHKPDGTPYPHGIGTAMWRRLARAAGLDKKLSTHVLRHTCAIWCKLEGVPLMIACDYLGMTPQVLQRWYGTFEIASTVTPAAALNKGAKMKWQQAELRRLGAA